MAKALVLKIPIWVQSPITQTSLQASPEVSPEYCRVLLPLSAHNGTIYKSTTIFSGI